MRLLPHAPRRARCLNLVVIAALLFTAACIHAQTVTDDQLAEQFMPPAFAAAVARGETRSDERHWRVLPVDLDHTGRNDYLAVVYGENTFRLIRKGTIPALVGESSNPNGCDSSASVTTIDLDNDGRPELEYVCSVGNAGHQFSSFFKWTAGTLVPLNPPSVRRPKKGDPIMEANFVDIDGNGVLGILSPSCPFTVDDTGAVDQCWAVYRLVDGRLTKSAGADIALFESYVCATGKPEPVVETFVAPPGAYTLSIVNGERGQNMVSSAVITLNGATVASPNSFSKNARVIPIDVTLVAQNTLSVELRSTPGSMIHILLARKP